MVSAVRDRVSQTPLFSSNNFIPNYDDSNFIDILYLNFKKAFDKVINKSLLTKWERLEFWVGLRRTSARWKFTVPPFKSWVPQLIVPLTTSVPHLHKRPRFGTYLQNLKFNKWHPTGSQRGKSRSSRVPAIGSRLSRAMPFNPNKCSFMHIGREKSSANYSPSQFFIKLTIIFCGWMSFD